MYSLLEMILTNMPAYPHDQYCKVQTHSIITLGTTVDLQPASIAIRLEEGAA